MTVIAVVDSGLADATGVGDVLKDSPVDPGDYLLELYCVSWPGHGGTRCIYARQV